jgi:hypothetical protein
MLNIEVQSNILTVLLKRRAVVQQQLDAALTSPASYSIQGSYSETARGVEELRDELSRLDAQIHAICSGQGDITSTYPTYV